MQKHRLTFSQAYKEIYCLGITYVIWILSLCVYDILERTVDQRMLFIENEVQKDVNSVEKNKKIYNLINKAIDIVFWLCMTAALWVMLLIFVFASFKIPSDSMEPGLITGDNILVWKPTVGPRIFNLFASMRNEQTEIYRIPGFKKIKRNDILVFNFPHPNSWDKIEMHILKYYIKRCVGIPGDTLSIRNGFFHVEGVQTSDYIKN